MDAKDFIITIIVAIATCVVTLIVKDLYESAKNKNPYKKVNHLEEKVDALSSDMALIKEAQKNALWLSLTRTYHECMTRGKASELEKAAIRESFESYSELGGNHGMEDRVDEIMKLPLQ
jgi:hypothetical protein